MENHINEFIFLMSGLRLKENDSRERYALQLGSYNPIVIGYDKSKPRHGIDIRYSAHVKMLELFAQQMKDMERFQTWIKQELTSRN